MGIKKFEVRVPGSTANLGPGFDSFGLALSLYLTLRVETAEKTSIRLIGDHLGTLPTNEDNLVYQSFRHLFDLEGQSVPEVSFELESEIPLARGLGSSGSAIIAGLMAANQLLESPKSMDDLFQIAAKLEGHPDNIGASLFGGFVITVFDGKRAKLAQLPFPEDLKIMVAIPDYLLSTSFARGQIPKQIPLNDVSYNIGHAALLIAYLSTGQIEKLSLAMRDRVHQPYRQSAVKGLSRILQESEKSGVFSGALSGAGPSIVLFYKEEKTMQITEILDQIAQEEEIVLDLKVLSVAKEGAFISSR